MDVSNKFEVQWSWMWIRLFLTSMNINQSRNISATLEFYGQISTKQLGQAPERARVVLLMATDTCLESLLPMGPVANEHEQENWQTFILKVLGRKFNNQKHATMTSIKHPSSDCSIEKSFLKYMQVTEVMSIIYFTQNLAASNCHAVVHNIIALYHRLSQCHQVV